MSLPARRDQYGPNWMVVATVNGVTEAAIIAGRLKSLGIQAIVEHTAGAVALGLTVGAMGQARVLVSETDYEAALMVLEPDESIPWLDDGDENPVYDDEL